MNNKSTKFELHYYFSDSSHTMHALTRNKCEHELLNIISEVAQLLQVNVEIESEAYTEGGLKEIWSLVGKNNNQITIILVILTLLLSRFPTTNKELEKLEIEEKRLSIQEKRLNIEKLKYELKEIENKKTETPVEEVVDDLNSQIKILKHKSNFYTHLILYQKVTQIGATRLNDAYVPMEDERIVKRKDFDKFILKTDNLEPSIDENATIEIISPVLKKGNYKWKGMYEGESISFYMKDKEFKDSVIQGGIQFKNGTFIVCVLEKALKIDNIGEIIISGYAVTTVITKYDDIESIETIQGKRYFRNKKARESQMSIWDFNKLNQ